MIKKKEKKVTLTGIVPRSFLVEAEEGGWRRSGGIRGGQDCPHQTTTKTMATGKAAKETVVATKHEGASLSQIRDVIQVIFFFIYYFSRGVKSNPRYPNRVISRPDCIGLPALHQYLVSLGLAWAERGMGILYISILGL